MLASTEAQLSYLETLKSINVLQYIIKHKRYIRSLIFGITTNSILNDILNIEATGWRELAVYS